MASSASPGDKDDNASRCAATMSAGSSSEIDGPPSGEIQDRPSSLASITIPPDTATQPSTTSPASSTYSSQLPSLSPDTADRVFPIRSVISVNPVPPVPQSLPSQDGEDFMPSVQGGPRRYSLADAIGGQTLPATQDLPTTFVQSGPGDPKESPTETALDVKIDLLSPRKMGLHSVVEDVGSRPTSNDGLSLTSSTDGGVPLDNQEVPRSVGVEENAPGLTTARFRHAIIEGGHAVITGRDGSDLALQRCEDEAIHIPGAVQGFGVLIALREESEGKLVVRVASENSKSILGYSPTELFELESFGEILSEDQEDNLLDHVDFIKDEECDPQLHGPEVFILTIQSPEGEPKKFWCAIHVNDTNRDLIICELELEDDHINPLNVAGETTPEEPLDTLGSTPTSEELAQSTINANRPLRLLRSARRRRGEAAAMKVFNLMSQVQEQLSSAPSLDALLNVVAGIVKELTGFHRVMVYQFDSSWNGMVVAELVDPKATKDLYKGLHFPASDIPKQARDLYKVNKVRLLYDRDQETARLVCRSERDLETPLDMTYSYLRAMSPIHLKYLANMAVRSSMSISITAFNELWGLISCHSYGTAGTRVSFPIRKMCRMIGDTTSRNIERLSYASRLQARKLINTVPTEANPSGYIIASSNDLLQLFEADYGAVSIRDETKILGRLNESQEVLALLEYLRMRRINSVLASHDITEDFPDLNYAPGFRNISGLLYVPLSTGGSDFIVFFRRGQLTEVRWAGNPYEKDYREGTSGYLEPRKSFRTWKETIMTRSREWSEADVETAAVLCLVYGKFIEVWRQKEAVMQSTHLTKLLLANSAHEVRTPLNAIVNYLEIALEGSLDGETRDNLAKSHSASKSLIYVINDLLDLTNTENGQSLIKDEIFDLPTTLKEATDMFEGEAKRKNISFNVIQYPGIPKSVLGDQRRVRQVITNVISNAIQHTSSGAVTVETWPSPVQQEPGHVDVEVAVNDTGSGMSQSTVETLFRELEQVSSEEGPIYYEQSGKRESSGSSEHEQNSVLGLGLALVARIVRNMQGQLSVKSEEGKGSRFKTLLRFPLPVDEEELTAPERSVQVEHLDVPPTPPPTEGEFLLVDRNMHRRSASMGRPSNDSSRSGNSRTSSRSGKSDVDRLVDAIQERPFAQKSTTESPEVTRRPKRGGPDRGVDMPTASDSDRAARMSMASDPVIQGRNTSPVPSSSATVRTVMPLGSPRLPGQQPVTDSAMPLSALRVQEDDAEKSCSSASIAVNDHSNSGEEPPLLLEEPPRTNNSAHASTSVSSAAGSNLHVLVAEDDPINSKILQKRLEKSGHTVHMTVNGEECAIAHREDSTSFDAVLMDIQMPIVDGVNCAKMIREFEGKSTGNTLSAKARCNGRIPIFAVSASLVEKDCQKYIDCGFDGWILKPIDFKRVNHLLHGVQQHDVRNSTVYEPGMWEKGGWFEKRV